MRKYKVVIIPAAQKAIIYSEGKQAFTEGQHRGYNPYAANNLTLQPSGGMAGIRAKKKATRFNPPSGKLN